MIRSGIAGFLENHSFAAVGWASLVLLVLLAGSAASSAPRSLAAPLGVPCGTQGNYFDGTPYSTQTTYGAFASISTGNPTLCDTAGDSSAWAMLSGGGQCQYTQVGYVKQRNMGDVAPHRFLEVRRGCGYPATFYRESATVSGTHSYRNSYIFSVGRVYLYWDTTKVAETTWDPALVWTPGWAPEFNGETLYPGDNVPGTTGSPVYFSSLKRMLRDSSWVNPINLTLTSSFSYYKYQWDTVNQRFHIWTQR